MSNLYNYFITCWKYNKGFTEINLDKAVTKGLITADEKAQIILILRDI